MPFNYKLSVPGASGLGPKVVMFQTGLQVNANDLVLPQQLLIGTNGGTPGDGVAISAYHVVIGGVLGAEPGSNWPGAAEDQFPTSGSVTFRSKNLYHYDPSALVNGTGSQISAVNNPASASATNGRVVVTRRGTSTFASIGFTASGSPGNNTYGWILTYSAGSDILPPVVGALGIGNCQHVVVDGYVAQGTGASNGFAYTQGAGSACANVFFRDSHARGIRSADGNNNGFMVTSPNASSLAVTSLYFDNCTATDCGGYGFGLESVNTALNAVRPVVFTQCTATDSGRQKNAWGFGGYARFAAVTTGWTLVTATRYSRAEPTQVRRVADHGGVNFRQLTENTGTPTTPGANEWGWSAGTLYIDIGESPNTGHTIYYSLNFSDGMEFNDCISTGSKKKNNLDGAGFGADTLTAGWTFNRCLALSNEGEGFVSNIALSAAFHGCIGDLNNIGIGINNAITAIVTNCTLVRSLQAGIACTNPNGAVTVRNTVLAANGTYGIVKSGTLTETNNDFFGNASGTINGASPDASDVTADPQLRSDYMPMASAVRTAGIASGRGDFYGKELRGTIGAVQYQPIRSVATRSVATRSAVTRSVSYRRTWAAAV